jgi:hypothetical protein
MAGIGIAKRGLGLLAKGGRAGFKKGKAVTKADLAKRDLWTKRNLKKRADIKRKSKWDIQGGIAGHPLNPFNVHAYAKAYDFSSKRKDVYVRTRDDLKKSRDKKLQGVGEAFQKMDYKDKAKGTYEEKDYAPKLTKRTHVGRKTGGRIGLWSGSKVLGTPQKKVGGISRLTGDTGGVKEVFPGIGIQGGASRGIKKGTAYRKEIAGYKRAHHTKQKILKRKAARKEAASKAALAPKYGPYGKQLASQAQHPKSWRRAGKT